MKISKRDFLKVETWTNYDRRIVVTADITIEENVGEIHHGFNKKVLSLEEMKQMVSSKKDPGDWILENFPADGTYLPNALERISIDEAYSLVDGWLEEKELVLNSSYEHHYFNYEVSLYPGFGFWMNNALAFEAHGIVDALVCASIADHSANLIDCDDPAAKEAAVDPESWIFLDRSEHKSPNVYLNIIEAKVDHID